MGNKCRQVNVGIRFVIRLILHPLVFELTMTAVRRLVSDLQRSIFRLKFTIF